MNKKVFGVYIELIGYRVCELLIKEKNISENEAINLFVSSNVYDKLSDSKSELIMYNPDKIYQMLLQEYSSEA